MRATRGLSAHSPAQPARAITTALSLSEARPIIKRCELLLIDLVGILHGCLQHRRHFSEEVAGPSPLTVAACGVPQAMAGSIGQVWQLCYPTSLSRPLGHSAASCPSQQLQNQVP